MLALGIQKLAQTDQIGIKNSFLEVRASGDMGQLEFFSDEE